MKLIKTLGLLSVTIISIVVAEFCETKMIPIGSTIGNLVAGFSIPYLFSSIIDLMDNENWKTSQRKLTRAKLLQKNTTIRISFAYLFRIKIDDKYFLVLNNRTGKYQPVGGAYKFNKEEANYLSSNIPVENDDCIPIDEITKKDYRLLVKNKDLRAFIKRFNKTSNRENIEDLSREFIEEIFISGILEQQKFGDLAYKYCGRHITNVEKSIFGRYELLLADIIEVRLTNTQEELIRQLMDQDSSKYKFATYGEIEALGVRVGTRDLEDNIANHTYKILSGTTDILSMRHKYNKIITVRL